MKSIKKEKIWIAVLSCIWLIVALVRGQKFAEEACKLGTAYHYRSMISYGQQIFWSVLGHIIAVLLIIGVSSFLVRAVLNNGKERRIVLYSVPLLIILIRRLYYDLRFSDISTYYVGDEKLIWDAAIGTFPFFFVYMSEIFLICFYILPVVIAPSIIKVVLSSIIMGYVIYRAKNYYKTNVVYFLYAICFLPPIKEMGIRVHRMHWYGIIYLFVAVKLYFDFKEKRGNGSWVDITIVSVILSVLTVLRREGLYLFVFGATLIILTYLDISWKENKKAIIISMLMFLFCELVVYYPAAKNGFGEKGTTYRAYLVHMLGEESFDREMVSEELKIVNQLMDVSVIDQYNHDLGDEGYIDCMYDWSSWNDGKYYAIRNNITVSEELFYNAVIRIIKKEPMVFIRSRIKAFTVAGWSRDWENLFIPFFMLLLETIYSFSKKNMTLLVLCLGVLCHTSITILTMPASYFKYFWEMYLFGYYFMGICLIDIYDNICLKMRSRLE